MSLHVLPIGLCIFNPICPPGLERKEPPHLIRARVFQRVQ